MSIKNKNLRVLWNGEVRLLVPNGKRGPIWSKTVVLKCSCGKSRLISKRKLPQYKTEMCISCFRSKINLFKIHKHKEELDNFLISDKLRKSVCLQINGEYVNV